MVAIPTLAQEDAKRPNRERESLVGEQIRIVNRMKAALARLGIRGFNPKLKKAVERLDGLRTPEGEPIPPNTLAELKHDMERRRLVRKLKQAIMDYLDNHNGHPKPYIWTKTATEIFSKVARAKQVLESQH